MNCLVTAATPLEINLFIQHCRTKAKVDFMNLDLDFLITGVGMLNTSYSIMKHLQVKKPDFLIQAGIAGSFTKKTPLGSVVVVKEELIADLGVDEKKGFKDLFDLKLAAPNEFPFIKKKLINQNTSFLKRTLLQRVVGITVNQITTSKKSTELYKNKFNAEIETMEGAALHYICIKENIPFVQLRSISNYVGDRNKKKWKLKEALDNLNVELIRYVESL